MQLPTIFTAVVDKVLLVCAVAAQEAAQTGERVHYSTLQCAPPVVKAIRLN